MKIITKLPTILGTDSDFLEKKYRHKAAITKGNKVISYGECTLGGCRFINGKLGGSCHAEINAMKPIWSQLKGISS